MRAGLRVLAILVAAPGLARAENVSGLYVGVGAGLSVLQDQTATATLLAGVRDPRFAGNVSFDPGYVGVASIGWGFGNGIRAEIQGFYRYNSVSRFPGASSFKASEQAYGGFVNVFYDFDFGGPLRPYLGVGIGEQTVQYKNGSVTAPDTFIRLQHEHPDLAYQGIVGASFDLPVPGLALTAEYRFVAQPTEHLIYGQYFAPGLAKPAESQFENDYDHQFLVGLRYAFNTAPPAPPPSASPAPPGREVARTYLVFFDWDRADLTERGRQIVAEAAQASTRVAVTRIEVDGHADRSGASAYNQGLSVRRAQVVASELVRLGVPRAAIMTRGFGESRTLVQTADGVREPQNRRVEIILR